MDSLSCMKELSAYYKGRYEKAVSRGITESSKYYAAFREIYLRYRSTETAAECMELLGKSLQEEDFRRECIWHSGADCEYFVIERCDSE